MEGDRIEGRKEGKDVRSVSGSEVELRKKVRYVGRNEGKNRRKDVGRDIAGNVEAD